VKITILSPKRVVYEGEAKSLFLPGEEAEFEILEHHAPIVSMLRRGFVTVDWETRVPIEKGMVRFENNECVILVE